MSLGKIKVLTSIINFLKELRRRNVFKVGTAYVIVAWLLMQLTEIAAPALRLPEWTLSLITYLLIIGFPLILLFAWAYEMTPEGFKPTHHVELDESITQMTGRKFDFAIIGLLSVALFYVVLENYVLVDEVPPSVITTTPEAKTEEKDDSVVVTDRKSVAVLPFANRSKSEDDAFFVDGLHDDLLTHLSKIADMKVISRTSVMRFRDTEKSMQLIGDELNVATIMEGGVQRAGNQVRINVQLIDAQTDEHLWAEIYDRELTATNIFTIQTEIATAIAQALRSTLTPEEQERLATVPTENLAAYEAYMLGRQWIAKRTSKSIAKAVDYFKEAIELDPNFALAYVNLADSYQLQETYSGLSREVAASRAKPLIDKALELDDQLGEAYVSLASFSAFTEDHEATEQAYKRAIKLSPNYARAYFWYGLFLDHTLGLPEKGLDYLRQAIRLDPLSAVISENISNSLSELGYFDEGLVQLDKTLELDPELPFAYANKGSFYWTVYGQLDKAVQYYKKALSLDPESHLYHGFLGDILLDLDDDKIAACWIMQSFKLGSEDPFTNLLQARLHTLQGNHSRAATYARNVLKTAGAYYSLSDAINILQYEAIRRDNFNEAREIIDSTYPALLKEKEPDINRTNYKSAIALAYILSKTGEQDRAEKLLDKSLSFINSIPRLFWSGYLISDVQIHAIRGDNQEALSSLRKAIDEGWRFRWRDYLEHDPILDSIREEPEFQMMLAEIKTDMAEQLARVKQMEKEGDVCVNP